MDEGKLFGGIEQPPAQEQEENPAEQERELTIEEINKLSSEMSEYLVGLQERIKEIQQEINKAEDEEFARELNIELKELEDQLAVLDFEGWVEDIEAENYEGIVERPVKKE